jgi:thiol-disulfide isomerase/thioredoxin
MDRRTLLAALPPIAALLSTAALPPLAGPVRAQEPAPGLARFDGLGPPFVAWTPPTAAPDVVWRDGAGADRRLSSLRGRPVLLTFWATWCAPCVAEMPALDRLAAAAGDRIAVLPIALDAGGVPAVRRFYDHLGIAALPIAVDPLGNTAYASDAWERPDALPLFGLPMTWFIDAEGRQVGYVTGAADWSAPSARALIDRLFE